MKGELKFIWDMGWMNIKNTAALRLSFWISVIGMMVNNFAFIFVWVSFIKVMGNVGGWQKADIVGLQGFAGLSIGLVTAFCAGLRRLPLLITNGGFDVILISPVNLIIRAATSAFGVSSVGDILYGIICLNAYAIIIDADRNQVALIFLFAVCGILLVFSIFLMLAALSFYIWDSATIGGRLFEVFATPSLMHGGAIRGSLRFCLTFVVPSLVLGTIPVEAVRGLRAAGTVLVPIITFIWFLAAVLIFNRSIRRYESSNLLTFN
jgi:ABC-2 type transport system permease protein